jgi:D-alanyl-D-alanine dipeptidase
LKKPCRLAAALMILILLASPAAYRSDAAAAQAADRLIDVSKLSAGFVIDLRYATKDNFTGIKLYPSGICCLQEDTAWKLAAANRELMKKGYRIKIWDAYRPLSIQKKMWEIMPDSRYLANPYKNGSKHNRGAAVDVTLVDKNGKEVEMPSGFDEFSARASRNNPSMSAAAAKNLKLLTDALTKNGFKSISTEWWHFDDASYANYPLLDVSQEAVSRRPLPVEELTCTGDSQQAILVTSDSASSSKAVLAAYEKTDGKWLKVFPDMKAFIGKNGFKKVKNAPLSAQDKKTYKYEGDGCSPMGVFTISTLFGWGSDPGFKLPYRPVTDDDYWVSGNKKELYNVWINRKNGPDKNWTAYERLKIPEYKYAAVINYNTGPDRVPGNGSAIFLHKAGSKAYTSGCTAVSEADLLNILKWLEPSKKPVIIQGTPKELKQLRPLT